MAIAKLLSLQAITTWLFGSCSFAITNNDAHRNYRLIAIEPACDSSCFIASQITMPIATIVWLELNQPAMTNKRCNRKCYHTRPCILAMSQYQMTLYYALQLISSFPCDLFVYLSIFRYEDCELKSGIHFPSYRQIHSLITNLLSNKPIIVIMNIIIP